ncbi:hypothetical protein MUK70_30720 [Dyadobacter chenwenxiniae]|uniref:Dialkylrecorsinol condensing enzyme DarA n=1 Tax=Dyadobacter chenwenxiniae TaxID=2906456 RepID=A0A9X1PML9_9BACT|nr:hypothetical protein [Dyadobacter chenwenxiniae]MCF0063698.1 hypothetical protein [Dyadobacter chenwenxiniae]UON83374.1 hypothetical protein MUK70_30720 [Dyadobacter chenwenxiniae]
MGKILVVNYSQTGQLNEIIDQFLSPFDPASIERHQIHPATPFVFPWTTEEFFDKMPECVQEDIIPLKPIHFSALQYDLIVLGYQPWFLSPSPPITSLLKDPAFQSIMRGTPVVTIIGGRNMWLNSQESVKNLIKNAGGKLVGNIPLMDRTSNLISAFTILHWMLTGRKDSKWNIFPLPGVSDQDIRSASKFGAIVNTAAGKSDYRNLQEDILSTGLITIPTDILFIEQRAKKLFRIWANLIKSKGTTPAKRKRLVGFFKYYLLIALFVVAPVILFVYNLLIVPFSGNAIKKKKEYFCGVEIK